MDALLYKVLQITLRSPLTTLIPIPSPEVTILSIYISFPAFFAFKIHTHIHTHKQVIRFLLDRSNIKEQFSKYYNYQLLESVFYRLGNKRIAKFKNLLCIVKL